MHDNGSILEDCAQRFFAESEGLHLEKSFSLEIGASNYKRLHKFDLGSEAHLVLVECKTHTWTTSGLSPSAKFSIWNEAMYFFALAPSYYRKIMFVHKHMKPVVGYPSLAERYLKLHQTFDPGWR